MEGRMVMKRLSVFMNGFLIVAINGLHQQSNKERL